MDRKVKLKLLMVLPFILDMIALFFLPSEIPIHYNAVFQANGYGSKYNVLAVGIFAIVFGLFMNWIYAKTGQETIIYRVSMAALLIVNVINLLFLYGSMMHQASVGIIGGADGPTAIFLAGSIGDGIPFLLLIGLIVILACIGILKYKNRK